MKRVLETKKLPIKLWLDYLEDGAEAQARNLAELPFAFKHIAIMPDCHQGYGMPIGGVMATKDVVIPNAVGVDIGCGMCAVKTSLTEIDTTTLKKIMGEIRKEVPVGFKRHKKKQSMPEALDLGKNMNLPEFNIVKQEFESALNQLGTLGGGNHFIEIQKGDDGHIWVMIHSGSRNIGLKVATHYNKLAKELNKQWNKQWKSEVPPSWDLAFLPLNTKEGKAYMREMQYCVDFALANRKAMMDSVMDIIRIAMVKDGMVTIVDNEPMINIAHNYAKFENHFNHNVMVHRKGATLASAETVGIIPGSQGSQSYIVKGLGNPESFNSCSHGAGRLMSRKKAKEKLSLEEEVKKLDDLGVIHGLRTVGELDEAPGSYKDIVEVMKNQDDLVEITTVLTPLAVVKG